MPLGEIILFRHTTCDSLQQTYCSFKIIKEKMESKMNRNFIALIIAALLFAFLLPSTGFCTDYQSMTTKELSNLRGTMYNAPQQERDAFRAEWLKRINQMSPEEKQQYIGPGGGRGKGSRGEYGLGDGRGRGKGGGAGRLNSNGIGQGNG